MNQLKEFLLSFVRISGLIVISISLTSLSGHISGHTTLYDWKGTKVGMGINTAISFLFTGASLILLSNVKRRNGENGSVSPR